MAHSLPDDFMNFKEKWLHLHDQAKKPWEWEMDHHDIIVHKSQDKDEKKL